MKKLSQFMPVRSGEWGLVLSLSGLLAINTMVYELSDVVATAGFVSNVGASGFLPLWIVDMLLILVTTAGYALVVDRIPRMQLVTRMLGILSFLYILLLLFFSYNAPDWLTYPFLYLLADQQLALFPLAFWALANDVYTVSQGRRLFPVIGAGFALGSIIGNGLAAISANLTTDSTPLLALAAIILMVGIGLIWFAFRNREIRARQSRQSDANVRETIEVGIDYFKNVKLFKYLGIVMLLVGFALIIVEFHLLSTIEKAFTSDAEFQSFYGTYKVGLIVALLLLQWLVTGRLLERVPLKNAFFVLPVTLLVAAGFALAFPALLGAAVARFLARLLQRAWDEPARKAVQGLVPDERRGRISSFLDIYFYVIAAIIGCLVLGALLLSVTIGWLTTETVTVIYLVVAGVAALGAVWAGFRLRKEYDSSLLNWRLSRSRRKSMLDGIEF